MVDSIPPPTLETSRVFWNDVTSGVAEDAPLFAFGTITKATAVVGLRDELEQRTILRHLPLSRSMRVLDLGGGAGRLALPIARQVEHVTLVDLSEGLLEIARARAALAGLSNLHYVRAPVQDFPFHEAWDVIVLSGIVQYLERTELERLADRCADALRPRGRLLVKEPVTTDGIPREVRELSNGQPYHSHFRTREAYAEIFGRKLHLQTEVATLAHLIPWFFGDTEGAAEAVSNKPAEWLLSCVQPLFVALDPLMQEAERAIRSRRILAKLLAPAPVIQKLFIFEAPARPTQTQKPEQPALSVVVIAFNEESCVAAVTGELVTALAEAAIDYEIVLVDDGSRDQTPAIMQRMAANNPRLAVVPLQPNRGIGGALRAGFDAARGESVTWVPADGQIPPEVVVQLFARRHEAPMLTTVYASREDHIARKLISGALNRLIHLQTGQTAKSGGNYLFARDAWKRFAPPADDSMMLSTAFRQALTKNGQAIAEVPIHCRARVAGRSKVLNPRTIWRTVQGLAQMARPSAKRGPR